MNFFEFADHICDHILTGWKEDAFAEIKNTTKNNGVVYTGIYIKEKEDGLTPAIYLEDYYKEYLQGESVSEIIEDIRKLYEWSMCRLKPLDFNIDDYSEVKDYIIYRLVNYDRNKAIMEDCPHIRLDDLAVTFRWIAHMDGAGFSSALVSNDQLDYWGVGLQDILLDAQRNTERMFPPKVIQMDQFIREIFEDFPEPQDSLPMFIITNEQKINGATVMLYEDFLRRFSREYPGDYYILPSSIHEVILIPESNVDDPEELIEIVEQANSVIVDETEILSESVYYYDSNQNSISNICY